MAKYFMDCKTAEELRKEYLKLIKQYHPDRGIGGNVEIMAEVNVEYDDLFKVLKDKHIDADGKEYTAKHESTETPEMFREIISKIIGFKGIVIEICGSWIWLSGNTKEYREELGKEGLGFRWSPSKKTWYWRAEEYRAKNNRTSHSMDEIRKKYGSQKVSNEELKAIAGL